MLVCVDHGNKQIKTASRVFTSGLVESDTRPPFGDNILFYRGKYYTLSDQRNFFFFILFTSKIRSVSFALSAGRRIVQITYNYPI